MSIWKDLKVEMPVDDDVNYSIIVGSLVISPVELDLGGFRTICDDEVCSEYYKAKEVVKWCFTQDLIKQAESKDG